MSLFTKSFVFDFEEKIFDNDAWLDYSSDLPKNDTNTENRNQNNGAPFLATFTGGGSLSKRMLFLDKHLSRLMHLDLIICFIFARELFE